jgi:hypothetical protein
MLADSGESSKNCGDFSTLKERTDGTGRTPTVRRTSDQGLERLGPLEKSLASRSYLATALPSLDCLCDGRALFWCAHLGSFAAG